MDQFSCACNDWTLFMVYWQFLDCHYGFYRHFCHLEAQWHQIPTSCHIYPSWWPKYLEDWSYFMYFQWLNLATCFLTVFALSSCFLQAFLSFGDKTASQNTYWAASILPGNKNSWETGTFWSSSNFWTLCLDFQQCLDCYCSFACISPICMEKHAPPSTIGPYLPFLTRQTPGRWIIFDVLPITELCALFLAIFGKLLRFLRAYHGYSSCKQLCK